MKVLVVIMLTVALLLAGCADEKTLCVGNKCKTYEPYGWIDESRLRNECIEYKVVGWNVFWSIITIETIFAPILITGFDLWEPVGFKNTKLANEVCTANSL